MSFLLFCCVAAAAQVARHSIACAAWKPRILWCVRVALHCCFSNSHTHMHTHACMHAHTHACTHTHTCHAPSLPSRPHFRASPLPLACRCPPQRRHHHRSPLSRASTAVHRSWLCRPRDTPLAHAHSRRQPRSRQPCRPRQRPVCCWLDRDTAVTRLWTVDSSSDSSHRRSRSRERASTRKLAPSRCAQTPDGYMCAHAYTHAHTHTHTHTHARTHAHTHITTDPAANTQQIVASVNACCDGSLRLLGRDLAWDL